MNPKLTVGMAHFDDFQGLWATVQSLRLYHAEVMDDCEIVVVDNNPTSDHGKMAKDFIDGWVAGNTQAQYHPLEEVVGTSVPRDTVFRIATGDIVVCVDCHVLIAPGALARLISYFQDNPGSRDLISGPMVYDNLSQCSTHFDDTWRAEMWGIWGTNPLGEDPEGDPFEIQAMGLGLFGCRREAWLGFNEHMRGFGGEEFYIHEKFRQAGAKCLCLPWLRWCHRFGRPGGVPYTLTLENKVRNYIIGHKELGIPLDRVHEHFVDSKKLQPGKWDQMCMEVNELLGTKHLLGRPRQMSKPKQGGCGGCGKNKTNGQTSLEALFEEAANTPSDINEHCGKLKELASQSRRVTEFGMRPNVSTVALLAGQPDRFVTHDLTRHSIVDKLTNNRGKTDFAFFEGDSLSVAIDDTDLLLIDTVHTADQLSQELERHAPRVTRWIAMHDTQIFGESGEDGGPGLLVALRAFLNDHREWSVVYHNQANNGLTVISCDLQDKPQRPGVIKLATHFAGAVAKHVANKTEHASQQLARARLEQCTLCDQRTGSYCAVCGCDVDAKATWASEECPIGKWIDVGRAETVT